MIEQLFAFNFGGPEMILVLVVVLLLFGGSKIPQLMRGVGKGMSEFQKGINEGKRSLDDSMRSLDDDETKSGKPTSSN